LTHPCSHPKLTSRMTIRRRMMLLVLPLLFASVVVTSVLTASAASGGIGRATVRLLLFKSEELRKQMYAQWDLLVRNGFADEPEYLNASRLTMESFARSIVQTSSEIVFAVAEDSAVDITTRPAPFRDREQETLNELMTEPRTGWIEFSLDRTRMVGEAFLFEPFGWYVVVANERSAVFSELRGVFTASLVVLLVTAGAGVALMIFVSRHLTRPIVEVVGHIDSITESGEFTRPLDADRNDELGHLARRFNYMASSLVQTQKKLADIATVATVARNRAASGERATLEVLGRAAEHRDNETAAHVKRVGKYAELLGSLCGLDQRQRDLILYAAPLHDVGKIGTPDSILFKPGKLTPEEFDTVKKHTTIGFGILQDSTSEFLRAGATIALYHHEWYDGSGYPNGIAGTDIPLFARIVAVVDTFDAVTSDRPYKKAWGIDRAIDLIREESGSHLDPELAQLFADNIEHVSEIMIWEPDK
jgi:HD-GYP domain-containing protein (c-di-GMP phosphodiesterase class II)